LCQPQGQHFDTPFLYTSRNKILHQPERSYLNTSRGSVKMKATCTILIGF
jgi:hypothetical protein